MTVRSEKAMRIKAILAADPSKPHADVAREVGVTREYVRQVSERKADRNLIFRADLLKKLRESKSWTTRELALKIGIASSEVSRWESGIHVPRQKRIKQLARAFGIEVHHFVTSEETHELATGGK